jgi:hypothetical protein
VKPAEQSFDLPRLDASTQPLLSEAVATLRSNRPDATELASLASRLALAGVDVALPAPAPPRAPMRWKKWLAGGGAASGVIIWLVLSVKPPPPHATAANQASRSLAIEVAGPAPSDAATPSLQPRSTAALTAQLPAPVQPELAAPATTETRDSERAPLTAHEATTNTAEPAAEPVLPSGGATQPRSPSNGAPRAVSGGPIEAPQLRAAPTEIELLRDARLALKQAPARALELVEAHARAYPGGKLTQERELIGISALVALGRRTAALSRGARFQHDFPTSPYRNQVEQLLR